MSAASTSKANQDGDRRSRSQKRQERRKQRLQEMQSLLYTKHFSNCRLPIPVASSSEEQLLHLKRLENLTETPRSRRIPLFVLPHSSSPWARMSLVPCPCQECKCFMEPCGLLGHYLRDHLPGMGVPFFELEAGKKATLTCHFSSLESDINSLLGVYGYRRTGLNPLKCHRNTHLPAEYRQYSQHGALMVFACRTAHSMLWQKKRVKCDVLALWVSTPLQDVSIKLRLLVQPAKSPRYYSKLIKARSIFPWSANQPCSEFIKTDSNVILISFEDLRELMDLDVCQQLLTVELKVISESRI
ncbi:uncharacterized protein LOC108092706 [Drosophila ficusphila]|uniref:uncharacterized protein LOC108092706 n=1 Tax=Drosophila ficusphila TaxID=30025 RepID=UPI0007E82063|nr:uncharacterized protein LOC108092706 [Drosophila ficusphila]